MLIWPLVLYLPTASSAAPSLPVRSKQCDCAMQRTSSTIKLKHCRNIHEALMLQTCSPCHRSKSLSQESSTHDAASGQPKALSHAKSAQVGESVGCSSCNMHEHRTNHPRQQANHRTNALAIARLLNMMVSIFSLPHLQVT